MLRIKLLNFENKYMDITHMHCRTLNLHVQVTVTSQEDKYDVEKFTTKDRIRTWTFKSALCHASHCATKTCWKEV